MTSQRPYLLRAMHDWILDNHLTPHILVDALQEGVRVPQEYVQDGQINLNIAPTAVRNLQLGNRDISFSARFRGVPMDVLVPVVAVLGIYARENGQGMSFTGFDDEPPGPAGGSDDSSRPSPRGKPSLRVVK